MPSWYLPDRCMGLSSLLVHKLRTLLSRLGMIFGVGAGVAMLAITAGVEKEMLAMIDQLGVNNIIIEAREANDPNELQTVRAISPGLTFRDYRAIAENIQGIEAISPRKRFKLQKALPKTNQELPQVIGVLPNYRDINNLKIVAGRFFTEDENLRSEAVCVLGEAAKVNLLGFDDAIGKYIKMNDVWLQVVGIMAPQGSADNDEGAQTINRNNLVIAPLNSVMRRFDDNMSWLKDEIDGIYIKVKPGTDSIETEGVVRAILASTHKDAGDFTVLVPAGLLKQKQATNQIFAFVMICIAGISLLVGGIGIMNIMLATVLERTREIGIRRAIGARQGDIVRQFLTEAVMLSVLGGLIGILFGFTLSRVIASAAGWSTVVTTSSIGVAFEVSVLIGLLFGIYPAVQAAKLDPIEAIRYE